MSAEYTREQLLFQARLGASRFEWNTDGIGSRNRIRLKGKEGRKSRVYELGLIQFKILCLISLGLDNPQIAGIMNRARTTVYNEVSDLYKKFDVYGGYKATLLAKLIDQGVLTIKPAIPEEKWVGLRKTS